MKRKILLALVIFLGCKNSNVDELSTIKGSYIFFEDAAVLQNTNEIYGVFMNEKARELNILAKNYKTNESDVINVEVKGVISTKKDSVILWENKIDIIEIISVTASKETNNTLKLGTK